MGNNMAYNPKSKENLRPLNTRTESERKEIAKMGAEATNRIKAEKVKRENANEYIWDTIGVPTVQEVLTQGTTQQKLDLLKAVLPKDVLEQKLSGSLDIVQPPVINILPVEVRHEDDTDAEAVDVSVKQ